MAPNPATKQLQHFGQRLASHELGRQQLQLAGVIICTHQNFGDLRLRTALLVRTHRRACLAPRLRWRWVSCYVRCRSLSSYITYC